jgi:hypothetical protein
MVAYEFYWRDQKGGIRLIGILPERRKNKERITKNSIMNWVKPLLGDEFHVKEIFFTQVTINNNTGESV